MKNKNWIKLISESYIRLNEGPIWGEPAGPDPTPTPVRPRPAPKPTPPNPVPPQQPKPPPSGSSGSITQEQFSAHAQNVIRQILQDAIDQGIISQDMLSQLAGQAFATWVAGGPSALMDFFKANNIPFEA
jgi:hypothetical protein